MEIRAQVIGRPIDVTARSERQIERAVKTAVKATTLATKDQSRAMIAGRLTARAGYLITQRFYEDGSVGYVHSRWFRSPRGGKVARGGGAQAHDVLAAHAKPGGTVIRPVRAKRLFIANTKDPAARRILGRSLAAFRALKRGKGRKSPDGTSIAVIPTGNGGAVVVQRAGKRGRDIVLGWLTTQVRIPQRLDFAPIVSKARRMLPATFLEGLNDR